ncbi:MAG: holo-[acyl-carrier-protein] synthase [Actinomycetota bacterium]|jgi:holo-[acyl-carrier protein] synthase
MIGLGIDAVDIRRFARVLERTPLLAGRVFTEFEREVASRRADTAAVLAARFAVREATMKVLGVGLGAFDFHDVSVSSASDGRPSLRVSGRAAELARVRGVARWHVSISHTDDLAVAVVAAD